MATTARWQDGQDEDLRRRIAQVCQRTLRRQAQEFMERPFVARRAQLIEYSMSPEEKSLYDDVTAWLLEPELCAFRGSHRRLLLIGFHRRMASSVPALASSLEKVADRLRRVLAGESIEDEAMALAFADDLEADELENGEYEDSDVDEGPPPDTVRVTAELARVEDFVTRARGLSADSKARALIRAVRLALDPTAHSSGKVVVFTESLVTQDYLRTVLVESRLLADDEITLFRGTNRGARASAALGGVGKAARGGRPRATPAATSPCGSRSYTSLRRARAS